MRDRPRQILRQSWEHEKPISWEHEKHCVLKILGLKKIGPPQAENFEDFGGCFMQKMPPDCTQERVFFVKELPQKSQKFPPAAGPKPHF